METAENGSYVDELGYTDDELALMYADKVVRVCTEAVTRSGPFEGQNRYVPYFWHMPKGEYRTWFSTRIYKVKDEDRKLFPELKNVEEIHLYLTPSDQVVEAATW